MSSRRFSRNFSLVSVGEEDFNSKIRHLFLYYKSILFHNSKITKCPCFCASCFILRDKFVSIHMAKISKVVHTLANQFQLKRTFSQNYPATKVDLEWFRQIMAALPRSREHRNLSMIMQIFPWLTMFHDQLSMAYQGPCMGCIDNIFCYVLTLS